MNRNSDNIFKSGENRNIGIKISSCLRGLRNVKIIGEYSQLPRLYGLDLLGGKDKTIKQRPLYRPHFFIDNDWNMYESRAIVFRKYLWVFISKRWFKENGPDRRAKWDTFEIRVSINREPFHYREPFRIFYYRRHYPLYILKMFIKIIYQRLQGSSFK